MKKHLILIYLILFITTRLSSQVSVVNIQLMPYNITPEGMLSATILNNSSTQQVQIISKLYNFSNELLLSVNSIPFDLKPGTNSSFDNERKVANIEYSHSNQGAYIKSTHSLPSGIFKICVTIIQTKTAEIADEFCDELESSYNQYLYLVYPSDKDTIESSTPMLTWTHSEPFNILAQGEYYRMIVTEIKNQQSAEEAIIINAPLMVKNYLTTHSYQYPYDAKELLEGRKYAWQVQKLSNGIITNKTEAWEFILRIKPSEQDIKYVALKSTVDAAYYTAYNGKIYFKFIEEYSSGGKLSVFVKDDKGKERLVTITNDQRVKLERETSQIKSMGDNRFLLNLNENDFKPGNYLLIVLNEKKEKYYLKFNLPK